MKCETVEKHQSEFPSSSWVLWSERSPDDGCVEEDTDKLTEFIHANCERVNGSVVHLSLTPSAVESPGYQNFHSPARGFVDVPVIVYGGYSSV